MNVRGLVIGCLLMGTAMACSDDDGGDSGSGGAGGVAASAASGTGGAGGAAIGTGGSGGTAVGTSGTGGAAGVGATGGSGGAVADPTNPASCPATAPNDNDPCTMDALDCGYGATSCTCEAGFGGMALQWNCNTMGGQTMACPAAQPTSGDTCTPGRGDCLFGTTVCDCINDTNTWACWDPADCPDTEPAEQAACDVIGMACDYGQPGQGRGGNNGCECTATGWDCGGQFCPATEPVGGGDCQGGPGVCSYGGDRVCDCDSQIWACWAESDCPTSPPANDSDCPLDGMICPFDGGDCECRGSGWDCDNGVTAGTDADGGV